LQHKKFNKTIRKWIVLVILQSRKKNIPFKESNVEKKNYVQYFAALTLRVLFIGVNRAHAKVLTLKIQAALDSLFFK